jgi:hypothetical protein
MADSRIAFLCENRGKPIVVGNLSQWPFFDVLEQNETWIVLRARPRAPAESR